MKVLIRAGSITAAVFLFAHSAVAQLIEVPEISRQPEFISRIDLFLATESGLDELVFDQRKEPPLGMLRTIGLAYARALLRLEEGDPIAEALSAEVRYGQKEIEEKLHYLDVFAQYTKQYKRLNEADLRTPKDRMRQLFALQIGNAMWESSGEWWCGYDTVNNPNPTTSTAEAGFLQSAANSIQFVRIRREDLGHNPKDLYTLLADAYSGYHKKDSSFWHEFADKCPPPPSGKPSPVTTKTSHQKPEIGISFQKDQFFNPALATEWCSIALRYQCTDWHGFLNNNVQVVPEAVEFLRKVEAILEDLREE